MFLNIPIRKLLKFFFNLSTFHFIVVLPEFVLIQALPISSF